MNLIYQSLEVKKDRFVDNKRRLEENGYQYALTTHGLQVSAENERIEMEKYIEDREIELDDLSERKNRIGTEIQLEKDTIEKLQLEQTEKEDNFEQLEEQLKSKEDDVSEVELQVDTLANELSDLKEAYGKLPYPEAETKKKLANAQEQAATLIEKEIELEKKVQQTNDEIELNRDEQSRINAAISQWEEKSKAAYELIDRYTSSYKLEENLKTLDTSLRTGKKQLEEKSEEHRQNKEELDMLRKNQIESGRQHEADSSFEKAKYPGLFVKALC